MPSHSKSIKESKSKTAIKAAARELFWKHGISRITVDEISQKAELSKMTFYRNFDNKIDLALEIIQVEIKLGTDNYSKIMHQDLPFEKKIDELMHFSRSRSKNMSIEFIKDIYSKQQAHQRIISLLHKASADHINQLAKDLCQAQESGEIRPDLPIQFIIHMLNLFAAEAENPVLIDLFDCADDMSTAFSSFFINGILNKKA